MQIVRKIAILKQSYCTIRVLNDIEKQFCINLIYVFQFIISLFLNGMLAFKV